MPCASAGMVGGASVGEVEGDGSEGEGAASTGGGSGFAWHPASPTVPESTAMATTATATGRRARRPAARAREPRI